MYQRILSINNMRSWKTLRFYERIPCWWGRFKYFLFASLCRSSLNLRKQWLRGECFLHPSGILRISDFYSISTAKQHNLQETYISWQFDLAVTPFLWANVGGFPAKCWSTFKTIYHPILIPVSNSPPPPRCQRTKMANFFFCDIRFKQIGSQFQKNLWIATHQFSA